MTATRVAIFEMSPRDGLQNEPMPVSTTDKVRLVDLLSACGFTKIEVTSFVSPKWVPQMADASEVLAGIARTTGISYAALTPNLKGYQGAPAARADEVAIFGSASEAFSKANINCTIEESLARFAPVVEAAKADGIPVRGYISCALACPYSGPVEPAAAARVTRRLLDMGVYEVSIADTIGVGTPETAEAMLRAVLDEAPASRVAGHYHDTNGRALDNIEASLSLGIRTFDASVGGLGGCPYAPGAKGNVDTLGVAALCERLGYDTGLDRAKLEEAAGFAPQLEGAGMSRFEAIRVETDARGIATLTLARPEKHNAMSAAMIAEIYRASQALGEDEAVRAVILTGEGRSFCAGADLNWMRAQFGASRGERIEQAMALARMLKNLNEMGRPLIGRINGQAYGGGLGLISVCDVAVGAETARFAFTETRLGIIPATISPYVLARMGEGAARRVFFSARIFDAAEAVRLGLLSSSAPADELDAAVARETEPYLSTEPQAVAAAKALARVLGPVIDEALMQRTADLLADAWERPAARSRIGAFLDKAG